RWARTRSGRGRTRSQQPVCQQGPQLAGILMSRLLTQLRSVYLRARCTAPSC
ncbi:hypothetical protein H4S00_005867, partial [Coemansia sp. D1744]